MTDAAAGSGGPGPGAAAISAVLDLLEPPPGSGGGPARVHAPGQVRLLLLAGLENAAEVAEVLSNRHPVTGDRLVPPVTGEQAAAAACKALRGALPPLGSGRVYSPRDIIGYLVHGPAAADRLIAAGADPHAWSAWLPLLATAAAGAHAAAHPDHPPLTGPEVMAVIGQGGALAPAVAEAGLSPAEAVQRVAELLLDGADPESLPLLLLAGSVPPDLAARYGPGTAAFLLAGYFDRHRVPRADAEKLLRAGVDPACWAAFARAGSSPDEAIALLAAGAPPPLLDRAAAEGLPPQAWPSLAGIPVYGAVVTKGAYGPRGHLPLALIRRAAAAGVDLTGWDLAEVRATSAPPWQRARAVYVPAGDRYTLAEHGITAPAAYETYWEHLAGKDRWPSADPVGDMIDLHGCGVTCEFIARLRRRPGVYPVMDAESLRALHRLAPADRDLQVCATAGYGHLSQWVAAVTASRAAAAPP